MIHGRGHVFQVRGIRYKIINYTMFGISKWNCTLAVFCHRFATFATLVTLLRSFLHSDWFSILIGSFVLIPPSGPTDKIDIALEFEQQKRVAIATVSQSPSNQLKHIALTIRDRLQLPNMFLCVRFQRNSE